eukprot:scaffold5794_cov141-Cylindrotheca_fusiformis.AAC.6
MHILDNGMILGSGAYLSFGIEFTPKDLTFWHRSSEAESFPVSLSCQHKDKSSQLFFLEGRIGGSESCVDDDVEENDGWKFCPIRKLYHNPALVISSTITYNFTRSTFMYYVMVRTSVSHLMFESDRGSVSMGRDSGL